jgi:hypothetical protein
MLAQIARENGDFGCGKAFIHGLLRPCPAAAHDAPLGPI